MKRSNMIDIADLQLIETKLRPQLSFLKNKKLFITGGTGFFGKWLLEAINYLNVSADLGLNVTILSRDPRKFQHDFPHLCVDSKISFIQGDIRSLKVDDVFFDYIIHAATDVSSALNRENSKLMRSTIIDGAKQISDFANKTKCNRFLYTSSGAAYGPQPINMEGLSEDFTDNTLFDHNNTYASAKLESEQYFKDNVKGEIIIARCFAFSGPYLPLNGMYAFGNFINNSLAADDIEIIGDGRAIRSYLYAADLVVWLLTMLTQGKDREVYNVGSDEPISIYDLANRISNGSNKIITHNKTKDASSIYYPSITKAKNELGLDVYTTLEDSIKKTKSFHM